ncbi:ROK family transcriptional regulator [Enterococcus gilvus]|uniref:HTH marR-type domain-containing protein n=1 Tax=Enterococcus gilvus ATCC BAA-350 TaxID=1158614 RepID=R2XLM4_9ENTE|nr:ROK family transcriptional regulator [Enterococcus gilvus]EOI55438.1 hypothetical protein UKC_02646 [Enterococcus gilvus ATCC BAA-350]EOW82019.1 hypothetical protein I592_01320 [Enterococcus gilvus ATCC BAA-350]
MNGKKSGKVENQLKIIDLLRTEGPLSRKVIADKLILTRASITQLTTELLKMDILLEIGEMEEKENRAGRKEILIDLNNSHWHLLGLDIEADMISIGISTIDGHTIGSTSYPFDTLRSDQFVLKEFLDSIEENINKLLNSLTISMESFLACGVAMVGRKSYYEHNHLEIPPILKDRKKLKKFLQVTFDIEVYLENNVRALAMAESLYYPFAEINSFLYVKIGPGLGSAIVFSDHLYRGVHGQAGEIGRSIVSGFYSNLQNSKQVTLEEIISLDFIIEEIRPYWNEFQLPYLFDLVNGDIKKLTMPGIYQALLYKEIIIEKLFKQKMRILAHRLYDYKNLLDLEKIYLFFSTNVATILYTYLENELKLISEELPTVTQKSSISNNESYLAGYAVAYIEGMKNLYEFN